MLPDHNPVPSWQGAKYEDLVDPGLYTSDMFNLSMVVRSRGELHIAPNVYVLTYSVLVLNAMEYSAREDLRCVRDPPV